MPGSGRCGLKPAASSPNTEVSRLAPMTSIVRDCSGAISCPATAAAVVAWRQADGLEGRRRMASCTTRWRKSGSESIRARSSGCADVQVKISWMMWVTECTELCAPAMRK